VLAWFESKDPFPPVERALKNPNGLLAAGGELSLERLLEAYRRGVFPWYSGAEPVLWWSPDPRMVLYCDELKVPRSLGKSVRNKGYEVRVDTAFADVLEGCADRPQTWLGTDMRKAYLRLHRAGYAHSFETWRGRELVGGSTAWRSAACSTASRCSPRRPMRRKSRWWRWSGNSARVNSLSSTVRCTRRSSPRSAPGTYRARPFCAQSPHW